MCIYFLQTPLACTLTQTLITPWKLCANGLGTSAAVNYANFCVGILELTTILDKHKDFLSFYGRFIDDGVGLWDHRSHGSDLAWAQFMADFNRYGVLKWTNTGMVNKLVFLDFVATVDPLTRSLTFSSYSKESNPHPHMPPKSAHQPKMLRGMIVGRLLCFCDANSNLKDFLDATRNFFHCLECRGHSAESLTPLFKEACDQLGKCRAKPKPTDCRKPIFFHVKHHPRGLRNIEI